MARLQFNVPFFRPSSDAALSRLPDDAAAAPHRRSSALESDEPGAGGWHQSSHDLLAGVSVSEFGSLDEVEFAGCFPDRLSASG